MQTSIRWCGANTATSIHFCIHLTVCTESIHVVWKSNCKIYLETVYSLIKYRYGFQSIVLGSKGQKIEDDAYVGTLTATEGCITIVNKLQLRNWKVLFQWLLLGVLPWSFLSPAFLQGVWMFTIKTRPNLDRHRPGHDSWVLLWGKFAVEILSEGVWNTIWKEERQGDKPA